MAMRENVDFEHEFGQGHFECFPGNEDIAVSTRASVYCTSMGNGLGSKYHKERLEKAKELELDYLICTCRLDNQAQMKILSNNGWKCLDTFISGRTSHIVCILGKLIERSVK